MRYSALTTILLAFAFFSGGCQGESQENSKQSAVIPEGALLAAACSSCHLGEVGDINNLSGWTAKDMAVSLSRYKSDESGTTVMHRLARGYTDDEIALISTYLGQNSD